MYHSPNDGACLVGCIIIFEVFPADAGTHVLSRMNGENKVVTSPADVCAEEFPNIAPSVGHVLELRLSYWRNERGSRPVLSRDKMPA